MIMQVLIRQIVLVCDMLHFLCTNSRHFDGLYKKRVILHLLESRTKEHQCMELLNNLIPSTNITTRTCSTALPSVLQLNTKLMVQTGDLD